MTQQNEVELLQLLRFHLTKLYMIAESIESPFRNEIFLCNLRQLLSELVYVIRDAKKAANHDQLLTVFKDYFVRDESYATIFKLQEAAKAQNSTDFCEEIFKGLLGFITQQCGTRLHWYSYTYTNPLVAIMKTLRSNFLDEAKANAEHTIQSLPVVQQAELHFVLSNFKAIKTLLENQTVQYSLDSLISDVEKNIIELIIRLANITLDIERLEKQTDPDRINEVEAQVMFDQEVANSKQLPDYFVYQFDQFKTPLRHIKAKYLFELVQPAFPDEPGDGNVYRIIGMLRELYGNEKFYDFIYGTMIPHEDKELYNLPKEAKIFMADFEVKKIFTMKIVKRINRTLTLPYANQSDQAGLTYENHVSLNNFKLKLEEITGISADMRIAEARLVHPTPAP